MGVRPTQRPRLAVTPRGYDRWTAQGALRASANRRADDRAHPDARRRTLPRRVPVTADLGFRCGNDRRGAFVLLGAERGGLSGKKTVAIKLDYAAHYDTKPGVADFNGDGTADLAGFGPSAVGAPGVYIWLQPKE